VKRTGLHRKSIIRLLHGSLERQPRQRQRGRHYGPEVEAAIALIAEAMNYACAERLTPNLVATAEQLAAHGELILDEPLRQELAKINVSTVRRLCQRITKDSKRGLPRRAARCQSAVAAGVPVEIIPWDIGEAGHCEVDLVHHCGPQAKGDYVHTLQMVDVATGWSERWAVLGRSGLVMHDAFACLLARFPFPILEIHSDNGPEFLNEHLLRFLSSGGYDARFSRSRPGVKNDNRFVEESGNRRLRLLTRAGLRRPCAPRYHSSGVAAE
jgi:transposase InsO family protein